jgi:hypothetical protein
MYALEIRKVAKGADPEKEERKKNQNVLGGVTGCNNM